MDRPSGHRAVLWAAGLLWIKIHWNREASETALFIQLSSAFANCKLRPQRTMRGEFSHCSESVESESLPLYSAVRLVHDKQHTQETGAMAKTSKKQKKNETAKWIVRAGVGIVLLILIVLAIIDRSAKSDAAITTTKWLNAMQAATDDQKEFPYSDLSQFVTGDPEIRGEASKGQVVYSWHGIFRSYPATITCEDETTPVVVRIEGPGS